MAEHNQIRLRDNADFGATHDKLLREDSSLEDVETYRAPEADASWSTAGTLMIADIVGVGVLSLPSALAQLGWGMGPLFVILFFPLNVYTGLLLWRVKLDNMKCLTYLDVAKTVSGRKLGLFSAFIVYTHIWLTLGDYLLVLGESLGLIFFDTHFCKREWILIGCVCLLPFNQLRLLNHFRWLCWLNMATILIAVGTSLGYVGHLGTDETIVPGQGPETVPSALDMLSFATAFSKIAFAYAGQFLYLEIMAEMTNPEDFPKSFIISGPYQVGAYLIAACVGYYYKGLNATGLMINYIPFNGWLRFAAIMLFIHMIITYLIKANVLSRAVHNFVSPKTVNDVSFRGKVIWFFCTSGVLLSCYVVSNSIPFFESLTGLIGASFVPIACWNLPIIYVIMNPKSKIAKWEWPLLAFIFLLGLALTGIGTYSNMKDIVDSWEKYGAPFSCQCEGVWNTCECSGSHTGMRDACPL